MTDKLYRKNTRCETFHKNLSKKEKLYEIWKIDSVCLFGMNAFFREKYFIITPV